MNRVGRGSVHDRPPVRAARRSASSHKPRGLSASMTRVRDQLAAEWGEGARQQLCAMCQGTDLRQGHHLIERQELRRRCRELRYDDLRTLQVLYDVRNRLTVCEACHGRHHSGVARIPRALVLRLCPGVLAFAGELQLRGRFDREYPEVAR